uniref:G-protein coupled receptors family 3 profile domain-containing protein n=1 Tax=Tetraodon nigroviridis TaxID=99883 RepID=H3D2N4_TETNG
GPGPARDRPLVLVQQLRVPLGAHLLVSSAAALTIISTLTILFLTIFNRRRRLLRAGGQDELLLLGLLLSSSSVLLSGLDAASPSSRTSGLLCSAGLWTLWVGHSLTFAVVFTRTWALSAASTPPVGQSQLKGSLLGCLVLWALLLDLGVLTSWQLVEPLRWLVLRHGPQTDPADPDVLVQRFSEQCGSANMELWLTAVYGYKGPLLGLGCYLAWSVSAGSRPAEGGKRLGLAMFALAAFSVAGAAVSLLTSHSPSLRFCLGSVLVLSCHVLTLGVLF